MQPVSVADMKKLQTDNYNFFADFAKPLLLSHIQESNLSDAAKKYLTTFRNWNLQADANEAGQTVFQTWWDSLQYTIWHDEMARIKPQPLWPDDMTLLESLLTDSSYKYVDDINTAGKETLSDDVTISLEKAAAVLTNEEANGKIMWAKHKSTSVFHLLRTIRPFARTGLPVGGWDNTINAITTSHGPSWRMVVDLDTVTKAYGIYCGGQNGNPGSSFYDNFIDTWADGQYYTLWMMNASEINDKRVKWKMQFVNQ
jgi:penicillin amidase